MQRTSCVQQQQQQQPRRKVLVTSQLTRIIKHNSGTRRSLCTQQGARSTSLSRLRADHQAPALRLSALQTEAPSSSSPSPYRTSHMRTLELVLVLSSYASSVAVLLSTFAGWEHSILAGTIGLQLFALVGQFLIEGYRWQIAPVAFASLLNTAAAGCCTIASGALAKLGLTAVVVLAFASRA